ncbi:MAG: putative kynureninase [Acidimicrobiaceae bacterium]|nr:MAG: putative kynureninase [Acidimicrobiaceae bacterium]
MVTRDDAHELDAADELAAWRDAFLINDPALVYLDGNSLGRAPRRVVDRLKTVISEEWGTDLIRSWSHWLDKPQRVGDLLAPLIGAGSGEVVVHDSTTVNLYQLVHGAAALRPDRLVLAVDENDFPSDRYVVDGIAAATGRTVRHGFERLDDVAVVVRSVVDYRTAEVVDVVAETARAHGAGALVVWDLSHAAGVLAIDLHAAGAQLAVGCTYKFLNGGPGSPAFTYVAHELQGRISQPIWGWFSQVDQFAMGPDYVPRTDIGRMLIGTPSILALTGAEVGIEITAEAGIERIAAKASALTAFGIELCDGFGLSTCTPREANRRGGHVSIVHPKARSLCGQLIERGVIPDFREPDIVRLGMSPLTTRFVDVYDGIATIASLTEITDRL